jgi:hypothetical protein
MSLVSKLKKKTHMRIIHSLSSFIGLECPRKGREGLGNIPR